MNQSGRVSPRTARILVIEDELAQREFLSWNLSAEGWVIIEAADGDEGLLLAQDSHPDAIVLDCVLPGRSGPELCRELKGKASVPRRADPDAVCSCGRRGSCALTRHRCRRLPLEALRRR